MPSMCVGAASVAVAALALLAAGGAQAQCRTAPSGSKLCAVAMKGTPSARQPSATARPGGPRPQDLWTEIVLPSTETWMLGWVEYNPFTCAANSGNWAVTVAPTRGTTRTGIEMLPLGNGDCPSISFPFNVMFYTWTDTVEENIADSFSATWSSPSFSSPERFDLTKAHVKVRGFDVATGLAELELVGPEGISGTLEATFSGTPVNAAPQTTSASFGPGATMLPIDRPALRKSDYHRLSLKWHAAAPPLTGKLEPPQAWQVLGQVRYSQYNVPQESACAGGSANVFVVDSLASCNFTAAVLQNRFALQVNLNGTGISIANGTLKAGAATRLGNACAGSFPPGATVNNSYLQVADARGSCNVPLVADVSLAVARGAGVACNRNLQLVEPSNANFGVRTRHDLCPACSRDFGGTEGHIDHFSSAAACSSNAVGDLGNYWTARTP